MSDFKRYANMFYSYRSVTVWSSPECLKQVKKRLDPHPSMDVYSFGMIMWELLHEKLPFEGEVKTALEYVVNEDARPRMLTIDQSADVHLLGSVPESIGASSSAEFRISEGLANIIRSCWQTDPSARISLSKVVLMLLEQKALLFDNEHLDLEESVYNDDVRSDQ